MATSKVEIWNNTLAKLGQDVAIVQPQENTKFGRLFRRNHDRIRDIVLAEHAWPFATRAVALALQSETAFPGWQYRYTYPADCLKALAICDSSGIRPAISQARSCYGTDQWAQYARTLPSWDVTYGTQDTSIVTDLPEAYLVYVVSVDNVSRYSVFFCETLACLFAQDLAVAIAGDKGRQLQTELFQKYVFALAKAAAHALNESRESVEAITPGVASRM